MPLPKRDIGLEILEGIRQIKRGKFGRVTKYRKLPGDSGLMVSRPEKILDKALRNPKNLGFREMVTLVEGFGFQLKRVQGSHHIFGREDIPEQVNIQEVKGEAKPYQVRQFLRIVERYNLKVGERP